MGSLSTYRPISDVFDEEVGPRYFEFSFNEVSWLWTLIYINTRGQFSDVASPSLEGPVRAGCKNRKSKFGLYFGIETTDLRGPEAEWGGSSVRLLPVLQDQTTVLGQAQVMAGGEVAQAESLTPADVATAPAKHKK